MNEGFDWAESMGQFLFYYERPEPATWVFLSSFLVIGLFVMFHRFWSMRNLDIVLILAFTPGLMMVYEGQKLSATLSSDQKSAVSERANSAVSEPSVDPNNQQLASADTNPSKEQSNVVTESVAASAPKSSNSRAWPANKLLYWGFFWLLVCAGLLVIRMLLDTAIVRRPLLDPNLSSGGMIFLGASLLLFLMANVATSNPIENRKQGPELGPGYVLLSALPQISTTPSDPNASVVSNSDPADPQQAAPLSPLRRRDTIARILAIGANLTLIFCIIAIGYWHFGNLKTGVGAATFYLLLPYTAHWTGSVYHVVPGALLLLAVLVYRQPFAAGLFLGCAAGVMYYPFSLLALWCSFYWQRGIRRFTAGFLLSVAMLVIAMIILHPVNFWTHLGYMFGIKEVAMDNMEGIWGLGWHPFIRIPIIVGFVLLSASFVFWPAQKNLATLLSCSAAIMAATQFWHAFGGGLYMAWFVPLALLTVFRPNLDYCIALEVVRPIKRRTKVPKTADGEERPLAAAFVRSPIASPSVRWIFNWLASYAFSKSRNAQ